MTESAHLPSARQRLLLVWLVESEKEHVKRVDASRPFEISGGGLLNYYAERDRIENPGQRYYGRGGYASHGRRRAGGTALANLAKKEFVELTQYHYGVPYYRLTDAGRRAVAGS
jgi:hypothetical protein